VSPYCTKIQRVLNYKKLTYSIHNLHARDDIKKVTKSEIGKVPVLKLEKDQKSYLLADSVHIALWLEKHFPSPALYPKNKQQLALSNIIENWAGESLVFYLIRCRMKTNKDFDTFSKQVLEKENRFVQSLGPWVMSRRFNDILNKQGMGRKPEEMFAEELKILLDAISDLLKPGKK